MVTLFVAMHHCKKEFVVLQHLFAAMQHKPQYSYGFYMSWVIFEQQKTQ
jgi:hypothetical protein